MILQCVDSLEFRGVSRIQKGENTYSFYRFENSEGEPFEFIGFEVEGESMLTKGGFYTVFLRLGRKGNVSLYAVQGA